MTEQHSTRPQTNSLLYLASSIPAGARGILGRGDPTHLVTYSYSLGQGKVVYSTIPLDFYLGGSGDPTVVASMRNYAANVVAYGNEIR
jgi:large repetitive protein